MNKISKIVFQISIILLMLCGKANALFPIPVPLIGNDVANNSADMVENLNAAAETLSEKQQAVEKAVERAKSGDFGLDAVKKYKQTISSINIDRVIPDIKLPEGVGKNVNNVDKSTQSIKNTYVGTLSEDGNQLEEAKINELKRTELMQQNTSALYAHALASRVNMAKEREMPATELSSENTREILQSNRAMADKMLKRWNDILFMVAQIEEYEGTKDLTTITLEPSELEDNGVNPGEDVKSDEEEAAQKNSSDDTQEETEQGDKK